MIIKFKFLHILISAFIKVGQKQVGDKEVKWQDVFAWSRSKTTFLAPNTPGGVLPYMGYMGMVFKQFTLGHAVYINQRVWV